MSHDRIELQRYFSESPSISSVPNGTMSASQSFAHNPALQHTDADTAPNPMYSSINDAQSSHLQYKATQHRTSTSPPPVAGATAPNGVEHNEYDIIPDKHKARGKLEGRAEDMPPDASMQAQNVLYADAEEAGEMRHKTLTIDDAKKYRGTISHGVQDEGLAKEEGLSCVKCTLLCWGAVISMLVILALAAGALALVFIFTDVVDICKCTGPTSEQQTRISSLENRIQELDRVIGILNNSLPRESTTATTMPSVTTPPMTDITPPSPMVGNATLRSVELFEECNTTIATMCTVMAADGFCMTPIISYETENFYVLNAICLRIQETPELNPLIATLDIINNEVGCICHVPNSFGARVHDVVCGLQVTRCRRSTNLTSEISLSVN